MATHDATEDSNEVQILAFLTKLNAWAQQLPASERAYLEALLARAAGEPEVEGFLMIAQPYEPGVRPVPSPDSGPGGYGGGGGSMLSAVTPIIGDILLNGTTSPTLRGFGC